MLPAAQAGYARLLPESDRLQLFADAGTLLVVGHALPELEPRKLRLLAHHIVCGS